MKFLFHWSGVGLDDAYMGGSSEAAASSKPAQQAGTGDGDGKRNTAPKPKEEPDEELAKRQQAEKEEAKKKRAEELKKKKETNTYKAGQWVGGLDKDIEMISAVLKKLTGTQFVIPYTLRVRVTSHVISRPVGLVCCTTLIKK